jgi:hypothetical protein
MKIVLATPLFPPDIAEPATYIREIALRLATRKHQVVVATYGRLPEEIPGVSIVAVDKRMPLPLRIFSFFFALKRALRDADALFAENGPSTELVAGLLARVTRVPLIAHLGDARALARSESGLIPSLTLSFFTRGACLVLREPPQERPEILPFSPRPEAELSAYEAWWTKHIETIEGILNKHCV